MLIYFMAIWNTSRIFGIFCDHSVLIVLIWYIFSCFGIKHKEKSGNPGSGPEFFVYFRKMKRRKSFGHSDVFKWKIIRLITCGFYLLQLNIKDTVVKLMQKNLYAFTLNSNYSNRKT
jgi:hypothetical protein